MITLGFKIQQLWEYQAPALGAKSCILPILYDLLLIIFSFHKSDKGRLVPFLLQIKIKQSIMTRSLTAPSLGFVGATLVVAL